MKLEINKELVLSTTHILYATQQSLENNSTGFIVLPYSYGWRLYVDVEQSKYFSDLEPLMKLAVANDCKWLVLDQDGETVPELKQYER